MLSEDQRVRYYLGTLEDVTSSRRTLPKAIDMPKFHYTTTADEILDWDPEYTYRDFSNHSWDIAKPHPDHPDRLGFLADCVNRYRKRLRYLFITNKVKTGRLAIRVGDGYSCNQFPVLTPYSNRTKRVNKSDQSKSQEEKYVRRHLF